jgi:ABC-2 type transport system ATP-binding protein
MTHALETAHLGKRYGRSWALRECTLQLPTGRIAALVGPNGAGKTTLLQLAVGLLRPTAGQVRVFGRDPRSRPIEVLSRIGFVAQDTPLYRNFSVTDLLAYGRHTNSLWDQQAAVDRITNLGIPLDRPVGKLSGGQQAQVSLAMALAKRPDLVLLDEPLATLDPLARREFLRVLIQATTAHGMTVLLSSHILSDLERVCDYLIILSNASIQLAGDISQIVSSHKRLIGPPRDHKDVAGIFHRIVEERHTERQTMLLAQINDQVLDPVWQEHDVSLEDIVLAYLGQSRGNTTAKDRSPGSRRVRRARRQTSRESLELVPPVSTVVELSQPTSGIVTRGHGIREEAEK